MNTLKSVWPYLYEYSQKREAAVLGHLAQRGLESKPSRELVALTCYQLWGSEGINPAAAEDKYYKYNQRPLSHGGGSHPSSGPFRFGTGGGWRNIRKSSTFG